MIAQNLGKDALAAGAARLRASASARAIDFPGQPNGLLLEPDEYYTTGLASSAIGYGVAVTAMQMVDVYTTIANGGVTRAAASARRDDRRARRPRTRAARTEARARHLRRRPRRR